MQTATHTSDVIVVGGGPAGSVLSTLLGRRGYTVELFDKHHFPREKACGEGLLPPGVELLEELGLCSAVGGVRLAGVRYHVGTGSVRAGFAPDPLGRPRYGLGQRRRVLDHVLWQAAVATAGVVTHSGVAVQAPLVEHGQVTGVVGDFGSRRARLVVAADGLNSTIRRKLGLEQVLSPQRLGIRAHYRRSHAAPPLRDIHVFIRDGYELYVTPLPDDEILVAALTGDSHGRNSVRAFQRWVSVETEIQSWLEGATQSSELMGRASLLKRVRHDKTPPGLVLLGDAAQSTDPVTAGGMSLALLGAALLDQHMDGLLDGKPAAYRALAAAQVEAARTHRWLGAGLRLLGQLPVAARLARQWMEFHPATMNALVALATTRSP